MPNLDRSHSQCNAYLNQTFVCRVNVQLIFKNVRRNRKAYTNWAICKSRNGESGNRMRGKMGMREIRVGMIEMLGVRGRIRGIRVGMIGMRGIRVGMRGFGGGNEWIRVIIFV